MPAHAAWKSISVCLVLVLGATTRARAQATPKDIVIGEERRLHSAILNEERTVCVGKPINYDQSDARYPVLFVLDGVSHFHHTTGLTRFLARNQLTPDLLVVGIGNTNRARDLTPPSQDPGDIEQFPARGGAAVFRSFIADELIPWVEQTYRTRPYRILVGHSHGGLFAIDTLISRPELFDAYIAISPSLQWNGQRLVEGAEALFTRTKELNVSLFMSAGNEGGPLVGGIRKLSGVLEEKAPVGFQWHFEHMPLESHGSVPLRSTYEGLEFIFSDWTMRDPFDVYERYGIDAIRRFYEKGDEKYGYERGLFERSGAAVALSLFDKGRLDEVADLISRFGDPPPPARVLVRLADSYREQGRTDRAIEWYRRALEADPATEAARQALTEIGSDGADPGRRQR